MTKGATEQAETEGGPAPTASEDVSREIRSIHTKDTIRVYQAYNDAIADSAVDANSFRAPLEAGLWSSTRMTWIKPSKVWMAYRCGFTVLKDKNQSRVLALDLSLSRFEELLQENAVVTGHGEPNDQNCRQSSVVVQWDPERYMAVTGEELKVFTVSNRSVRSIQIGLRGPAVDILLDPTFVLKITDVTPDFQKALRALQSGDLQEAEAALWPGDEKEVVMDVPDNLQKVLKMGKYFTPPPDVQNYRKT